MNAGFARTLGLSKDGTSLRMKRVVLESIGTTNSFWVSLRDTNTIVIGVREGNLGTFYLTDFLLRHFDRLVIRGLGLDRHPELFSTYFGNYRKLVYLAQAPLPGSEPQARAIAGRMGLQFEIRRTGYGSLETSLVGAVKRTEQAVTWLR